eukprot:763929-Hanusia_phi.AAC.12
MERSRQEGRYAGETYVVVEQQHNMEGAYDKEQTTKIGKHSEVFTFNQNSPFFFHRKGTNVSMMPTNMTCSMTRIKGSEESRRGEGGKQERRRPVSQGERRGGGE